MGDQFPQDRRNDERLEMLSTPTDDQLEAVAATIAQSNDPVVVFMLSRMYANPISIFN